MKGEYCLRENCLRKNAIYILCTILFLALLQPPTYSEAANETVVITSNQLNVRKGPGLSYEIVSKVQKGMIFQLLKEEGDWFQIDLGSGKKGWVANWLVSKESTQAVDTTSKKTATVTASSLRLRAGAGTSYQIIGSLQKGESLRIVKESGDWYEVESTIGKGWVAKEFIQVKVKQSPENSAPTPAVENGQVTVNSLNVRSKPSLESNIVGKLDKGAIVTVHTKQNGWLEITFANKRAWISEEFIKIVNNKETERVDPQPKSIAGIVGTVTATSINVRDSSSLNGKIIGAVSKGESFQLIEEQNQWLKIKLAEDTYGWVAGWFMEKSIPSENSSTNDIIKNSTVSMIHDGTNIRSAASLTAPVTARANRGDTYPLIRIHKNWYEVELPNGKSGFVAGWIVSVSNGVPQIEKYGTSNSLKNKTIMIDPGHGGRDNGATGAKGTLEKKLTLLTGQLLFTKLEAAGANVSLTRNGDYYISLSSRVNMAHYQNADVFISLHYDSIDDSAIHGMTSYYNRGDKQQTLASALHKAINKQTKLKDRGVRQGDYHVIRENKQAAVLLELGYLSNPTEENVLNSNAFQEQVTNGIVQGLTTYFHNN